MISIFDSDAQKKRCVVERFENGSWIPTLRARSGLLALFHAEPLTTFRIVDDIGVIVTIIDGKLVEAEA